MKNLLPLFVLISFSYLGQARLNADYLNPPDWNDCNDFTHQSWDFNAPPETGLEGPNLPLAPDGNSGWINTFGTPLLIDFNNTSWMSGWYYTPPLDTNRTGMYGGMGDTFLTFYIPNNQKDFLWQKHIWLQMTYFARMDGLKNYDTEIARDPNFTDANDIYLISETIDEPNETQGLTGKWYRLTAVYTFEDQPAFEYLKLTAYYDDSAYMAASMIDQVDIDTRCVNLDLAGDGIINFRDFALFANLWQSDFAKTDFYPDSSNDENDLQVLLEYWLMQN